MISIATWNVNSVKSRLPQLLDWLKRDQPSVVLLQEIKCVDEAFPAMEIEELGYNIAVHGEKSYNGVAILSKFKISDIQKGLPGNEDDPRARYIEAVIDSPTPLRVASVYVPNGQTLDSEKFPYKLRFLDRLKAHFKTLLSYNEAVVVGGDYNIAPEIIDVHDPKRWERTVLFHDIVRRRLRALLYMGMYDAFRLSNPTQPGYSWWDYRAGAFDRDDGLRIDHLLLSSHAVDRLEKCIVEKDMRAVEKASDHTPVIAHLR